MRLKPSSLEDWSIRHFKTTAVLEPLWSPCRESLAVAPNSHRFDMPERRGQELVAVALLVLANLRGRVAPFVAHQCCEHWA